MATLSALFSHVAGGGEVPGLLGLAVPLVLSVPVCVALAGRGLSLARLAVSVGVSQLLFHALFEIGAAAGPAGAAHAHGGPIDVGAATAHARSRSTSRSCTRSPGTLRWISAFGSRSATIEGSSSEASRSEIVKKVRNSPEPSMRAASSSSVGTASTAYVQIR